MELRIICSGLL